MNEPNLFVYFPRIMFLAATSLLATPAYAEQRDLSPQRQLVQVEAQIKSETAKLEELRDLKAYLKDSNACDLLQNKYWENCEWPNQKKASKKLCASLDAKMDVLWESWIDTPHFNERLEKYGFCGVDYVGD